MAFSKCGDRTTGADGAKLAVVSDDDQLCPDRSTAVRSRAKSTLLPVFAKRPIASIEPIDVRRFMAEKQAAGQAAKSLHKLCLVLRQVLETGAASGAIKSNPCDGLRLPKAVQMEPTFLSADQVEALARATRPPMTCWCVW